MKLKKVLSGVIAATMLATSSAIVMPLNASAAATTNVKIWDNVEMGAWADKTIDLASLGTPVQDATITIAYDTSLSYGGDNNIVFKVYDSSWSELYTENATDDDLPLSGSKTLSIADDLNGNTNIVFQGGHLANTYTLTVSEVEAPPFDGAALTLTQNSPYNWQGMDDLTTDISASNFDELMKTVSGVEVKFVVNGAASGSDTNYDMTKLSYQIQVNGSSGSYYPWIVGGTSSYDSATKTVTVSFDNIAETVSSVLTNDGKEPADIPFSGLKLIAMTSSMDDASEPVKLYHEDYVVTVDTITAAESVTVTPANLALKVGAASQLTAAVAPEGAAQDVVWNSSDTKIATVSADGKVTAVATGEANITATAEGTDPEIVGTCTVTVTNPATAIAIADATVLVGAEKPLTVTTTPTGADELNYTWTSSATNIATVTTDGVVKGIAAGTAKITVTAGTLTAECTVTVTAETKPATKVELNKTTLTLEEEGTAALTATITPAGSTDTIAWSSSNEEVATVDNNGKVTAIAEGKATITATANADVKAECAVTVTAKAPEIETKPYTLKVVDASGWGEEGVTKAAQVNIPITTLNGFKVGTTTYGDVKNKTLKLENLGFGSCTATGVKAENVDVAIYLQFGSGWTWCATGGNTLADSSVEYDLSTITGVKDTDVLQEIGFQFNIKGNAGGINDLPLEFKVTLNAAEPRFTVVGEDVESEYDILDEVVVNDYVPKNAETGTTAELVVMSITANDAARNESYTITVESSDGKSSTVETSDCYKAFTYYNGTKNNTVTASEGHYFIIVKVTGVPDGVTVKVTIEPTK